MLLFWLLYLYIMLLSLFVVVGNLRLLSSCNVACRSILLSHVIVGKILMLRRQLKVVLTHDYLLMAATWCPQALHCCSVRSTRIPWATLPNPSLLLLAGLSIHALRHQFLQVWTLLSLDIQGLLRSTARTSISGLVSTASIVRNSSSRLLLLTGCVGLLDMSVWFSHVIGGLRLLLSNLMRRFTARCMVVL